MPESIIALVKGPFPWASVFPRVAASMVAGADHVNTDRVKRFWMGYEDAKRNWHEKGVQVPYAPPPPLRKPVIDYEALTIGGWLDGPELVVDQVPEAPWVVDPTPGPDPKPEGYVEFGPPTEDGTGSHFAGNSNVPLGTLIIREGKQYRYVEIGRIGTLVFRKLWVPVSGGN